MAALDTSGGVIVIKDAPHALDKDTRTLFAADNLKNNRKKSQNSVIPELHLLSYYGDITGPKELHFRNRCMGRIQTYLEHIPFAKHPELKVNTSVMHSIFESIQIMHISHYSFEFALNISNTQLLDDYQTPNNAYNTNNDYLIGAYQHSKYQDDISEFVTIGLTSALSMTNDEQNTTTNALYQFYIDDFIQDMHLIVSNTSWYDSSCHLSLSIWYNITQYTMDCLLPISYTRSKDDEVKLNDGTLHLYLTGSFSGDGPRGTKTDHTVDPILEMSGHIFSEIGRIVTDEYNAHHNAKKLKSEYDKWKKHCFKKRALCKPLNMDDLMEKLRIHQHARNNAHTRKGLKYLYYANHHFQPKKKNKHAYANTTAMESFKNFFSLGSSNSKGKHAFLNVNNPGSPHRRTQSETISPEGGNPVGSYASISNKTQKKRKKNKKSAFNDWEMNEDYNWNNDNYGTQYVTTQSRMNGRDPVPQMKRLNKTKNKSKSVPFHHDENDVLVTHRRKDSLTMVKVKDDIRNAYNDYLKEKGKAPTDIQSFVNFCKRKHIKKANWTLCKVILSETQGAKDRMSTTSVGDVIVE